MSRDARETKMHYSPSEKDGVFVVEVSRGADTNYHSPDQKPQRQFAADAAPIMTHNGEVPAAALNPQEVQVHAAPSTVPASGVNGTTRPCSTGLSQSNLSLSSSSNDSNRNYQYGVQQPYSIEMNGYATSTPPPHPPIVINNVVPDGLSNVAGPVDRPVVTGLICKQETIDMEPRLQSDIDLMVTAEEERRQHHHNGVTETGSSDSTALLVPDPASGQS